MNLPYKYRDERHSRTNRCSLETPSRVFRAVLSGLVNANPRTAIQEGALVPLSKYTDERICRSVVMKWLIESL